MHRGFGVRFGDCFNALGMTVQGLIDLVLEAEGASHPLGVKGF